MLDLIKVVCISSSPTVVLRGDWPTQKGRRHTDGRWTGRRKDGPDISGKLLLVIISHRWNGTINLLRSPSHHKLDA